MRLFLVNWFEKERRFQKPKYLEGFRISWNIPMFVVHRWNIQSGKVQIYAATEFFKSHSTEMGVDMQIDRASIHLLSPSTTSTQPESSHQQDFEWNNVKLWTFHARENNCWVAIRVFKKSSFSSFRFYLLPPKVLLDYLWPLITTHPIQPVKPTYSCEEDISVEDLI